MTTVGPTAQRLARDAASVPAPPAPREPIHSETMRALVAAWFANCGREPEPSEVAEFRHAFGFARPDQVRRAIDEYATRAPEFMRLAGLRAMHAQIVAAARASDGSKEAEAERKAAEVWLAARTYEGHGFRFAETGTPMAAAHVRALVARHSNARNDHGGRSRALWANGIHADARATMRVCRAELAAGGYEYVGLSGGPTGLMEVEFDSVGWRPRAVAPTVVRFPNVDKFAESDRERNLAAWMALEAEVAAWAWTDGGTA